MIELIQFPWSPFCIVQRRILEYSGDRFKITNLARTGDRSLIWKLTKERYYAAPIIRDGRDVFFGSQSLRTAELDGRREVGIVVKDAKIVKTITATFEKDWAETKVAKVEAKAEAKEAEAAAEPATASA